MDILFTRGHHGVPGFPPSHWMDSPSEWDGLQYFVLQKNECSSVPARLRSVLFNRVFSHVDSEGNIKWTNVHGDPNFFQPANSKEVPSLLMITGKHVRHQLINMLNKQYLTSYHYVDFKRIQQHLYKKYGLLQFTYSQRLGTTEFKPSHSVSGGNVARWFTESIFEIRRNYMGSVRKSWLSQPTPER